MTAQPNPPELKPASGPFLRGAPHDGLDLARRVQEQSRGADKVGRKPETGQWLRPENYSLSERKARDHAIGATAAQIAPPTTCSIGWRGWPRKYVEKNTTAAAVKLNAHVNQGRIGAILAPARYQDNRRIQFLR
jgi:hypothetical protein